MAKLTLDKYDIEHGARFAAESFRKNGSPAVLMRVVESQLARAYAEVFALGRQFERENPGGKVFEPPPFPGDE